MLSKAGSRGSKHPLKTNTLCYIGVERRGFTQSFVADKTSRLGMEGTAERAERSEREGGKWGGGEDDKHRHSFTEKLDLLRGRMEREEGRWKKKSRDKKEEIRGGQTHSFKVDKTSC